MPKRLLLLISALGAVTYTILACAGGDWSGQEASTFTPDIIGQPRYRPFFRTLETPFYDGYDDFGKDSLQLENCRNWSGYLQSGLSSRQLYFWMYEASIGKVDSMIFFLKGKPLVLSDTLTQYSLSNIKSVSKATSFLYFLGYAKRNELLLPEQQYDWEEKKKAVSPEECVKQIKGGLGFFDRAKDPFLKERYAFQLLRLYYLAGDYASALAFYDDKLKLFRSENNLKWRALGYKAAALYKLKRYSESNILYSRIFDRFDAYRRTAMTSFHPQSGPEWQQTLALAANTHEKEVLWQMLGYYTDDVTAMKEIVKLNPKSELLDLLLVRAVNKEEEKLSDAYSVSSATPAVIDNNLTSFLNEASATNVGREPAVWLIAAAHLNYLKRDFEQGDKQIAKATNFVKGKGILEVQYHLTRVLGNLKRINTISKQAEEALLPDLQVVFKYDTEKKDEFRSAGAIWDIRSALSALYKAAGDTIKAELVHPGEQDISFRSITNCRRMIAYYDKPDKSEFENLFFNKSAVSKYDYADLLAILLAQQGKLEESLANFMTVPNERELYGNPFTIHIIDCHDCDHEAPQKTKYTARSFIAKMVEMKNTAASKPAEAAQNYFLMANGYYNMTYFGNARYFNFSRVYAGFYNYDLNTKNGGDGDLALKYYQLAMRSSKDVEFKAKCAFMISKCELNRYYTDGGDFDGWSGITLRDTQADFRAGHYFDTLRLKYSKTKYYAEIIKECGYFKTYLAKR